MNNQLQHHASYATHAHATRSTALRRTYHAFLLVVYHAGIYYLPHFTINCPFSLVFFLPASKYITQSYCLYELNCMCESCSHAQMYQDFLHEGIIYCQQSIREGGIKRDNRQHHTKTYSYVNCVQYFQMIISFLSLSSSSR